MWKHRVRMRKSLILTEWPCGVTGYDTKRSGLGRVGGDLVLGKVGWCRRSVLKGGGGCDEPAGLTPLFIGTSQNLFQ
jgi:hypothetical protein